MKKARASRRAFDEDDEEAPIVDRGRRGSVNSSAAQSEDEEEAAGAESDSDQALEESEQEEDEEEVRMANYCLGFSLMLVCTSKVANAFLLHHVLDSWNLARI